MGSSYLRSDRYHHGKGLGARGPKRNRKILRDNVTAIGNPVIRRLARRGGVKRVSASIYDEARATLKNRLQTIMKDLAALMDLANRKTVTTLDVVYVLNRLGTPIYGFTYPIDGSDIRLPGA